MSLSREPLDAGMLELFRGELEAHVPPLVAGLAVSIHTTEQLQNMMRAAHSIKGAARIVGLDPEADIAHELEACFQHAIGQNGIAESTLKTLRLATDFFVQLGQTSIEETSHWLDVHCDESVALKVQLAAASAVISVDLPVSASTTAAPSSTATASTQEPLDMDMLEMFRMEVEGHAASLNEGLLSLESNSRDTEKFQSLMRAAHSIKGAARIVGIEMGVKLAHEMEDCFVAAGNGSIELTPEVIDTLLGAVDLFVQLANCPPQDAMNWLTQHDAEQVALCQTLTQLAKTGSMHQSVHAETGTTALHNQKNTEIRTVPGMELLDESMLELFHMEVEGHTAALNEGLLALEQSADVKPALQSLMRAAHSIKGAARIVGIEMGVKLAHAMEDWFVAAQNDKVSLAPAQIDLLLKGVDYFVQLSGAATSAENAQAWLIQHYFELDDLAALLMTMVKGDAVLLLTPKTANAKNIGATPSSLNSEKIESTPIHSQTLLEAGSVLGNTLTGVSTLTQTVTSISNSPKTMSGNSGKVVRVSAENLNRLLGLAGESLVETRWHSRFTESLLQLKRQQMRMTASLRQLRRNLAAGVIPASVESPLMDTERRASECSRLLIERLTEFERFTHRADILSQRLYHEAVGSRMRPFDDGVQGFPRLVRDLARQLGKRVQLLIEGRHTEVDRDVLERLEAPLNHLVRNALDHGLESPEERTRNGKSPMGTLKIEARHRAGMLLISVSEDGRGVSIDRVKARVLEKKLAAPEMLEKMAEAEILEFLFLPGFSTAKAVTDVSGRGVGLDVVQNMVQESAGVVRIVTKLGQGTSFNLQLPITLSVLRALLVEVYGEPYAFPLSRIERLLSFDASELKSLDNRQFVTINGENIGIVSATQVLDLGVDASIHNEGKLCAVVIGDRNNRYGLVVHRFLGECELVVRPLDPRLGKVPAVSSVSVLEDGAPCTILDIEDVIRITDGILKGENLRKVGGEANANAKRRKRVLVVDDSFTVRETERKLLERHGYEVKTAVDGMEGWNAVRSSPFDLVVSDVDMPRMNGIDFVRLIKGDDRLRVIPVVIVSYKDREEDRLRGMDAGANYYLTKGSFQDHTFIQAISDLIGSGEELLASV